MPLEGGAADDLAMDGWEAAVAYRRLRGQASSGRAPEPLRDVAVAAVIRRAMACVRHASRPMGDALYPWPESPPGDVDLEASIDAGVLEMPHDPERLRVRVREQRRTDTALILDMSLSMTGEKIALMAVAAAVMALRLRMDDLAVIAFDSTPRTIKPLGENLPVKTFVRRVLEVPARGYTHLEAGLQAGLCALRRSTRPSRAGILLSDGVYNVGWDPARVAARFQRLHVVHLGEDGRDRGLCRRLATVGRGRYYRADTWDDLPRIAYTLVRDLFR